jgi:hypothetical protein
MAMHHHRSPKLTIVQGVSIQYVTIPIILANPIQKNRQNEYALPLIISLPADDCINE